MVTNEPRERGRPPLPDEEKKEKINITIDKDILAWVDAQVGKRKRSQFINKVLREALNTPDPQRRERRKIP